MEKAFLFLIDHFPDLLDLNFTVSFVILFVIAVRGMMKKTPKVYSYALWGIVLLRLLVPVSIESPVSFVPERTEFSSMVDVNRVLPEIEFETFRDAEQNRIARETTHEGEVLVQVSRTADPQTYLTQLWLLGAAGMLLWGGISYIRLRRKLRVAVPMGQGIFIADDIGSPFVLGLFLPKIYLPTGLGEKEQGYILLHEKHHIRRCDHIIRWLSWLALCVHWFNPFVWAAFILAGRDMEMSCDEAVLKKIGPGDRAEYSATLLTFATGRRILAGTPLAFGEGDPKGRIINIANWKKPAVWVTVVCLIVCGVLAVCLLTDPVIPEPPLNINFEDLDAHRFTEVTLQNCHNGSYTHLVDRDAVAEICAIIKSIHGVNGGSGKGYYEGSYAVTLYEDGEESFVIAFGDSDAFYYGEGEDGYPIRYEMEGLTDGGIIRLLSKYDASGFDWEASSTAARWGVSMEVVDATASGCRVEFSLNTRVLSADFLDINDLYFGSGYDIQKKVDGEWVTLSWKEGETAVMAAMEKLTSITPEDPGAVNLDWTDTYGPLEPGQYRLVMHISLTAGVGAPETLPVYGNFYVN